MNRSEMAPRPPHFERCEICIPGAGLAGGASWSEIHVLKLNSRIITIHKNAYRVTPGAPKHTLDKSLTHP